MHLHTRISSAALLAALLLLPAAAHAASKEDFAGSWKLDRVESERPGAPFEAEMVVSLEGDDLKIEQTIRRQDEEPENVSFTYVADGEPHEVPGVRKTTRTATAKWSGKRLTVEYTMSDGKMEFDIAESWKIRKGELEVKIVVAFMDQRFVSKQIYVRQ